MVGSIGVIYQNFGVHESMEWLGVEPRIIASSDNKVGLSPMQNYDESQAAIVKENMVN